MIFGKPNYSLFHPLITAYGNAADCYLKPVVNMLNIFVRYVCHVLVLTPTNTLLLKTGLLQLNYAFDLQICTMMQSTLTGFDVDHSNLTQFVQFIRMIQKF